MKRKRGGREEGKETENAGKEEIKRKRGGREEGKETENAG
jgi:hypothetical protein